jgi:hypothetical protein
MKIPLEEWVNGRAFTPQRFVESNYIDTPNNNWISWVSMEDKNPLYKANKLEWLSLNESITKTIDYMEEVDNLLFGGIYEGSLDNEDALQIRQEIGMPPKQCCPIYFITVGTGESERVVYIGKTKSASRFKGGHSVALKLHNPKYNGLEKSIYRASIWFYFNDDYLALDWIKPTSLAEDIFDSIESQLIYDFQPELNTDKKSKNLAKWHFGLQIESHLPGKFLHNERMKSIST